MTDTTKLGAARRRARQVEKVWRHVRRLRQRGGMRQAEAEVRTFRCGDVVVVPSGTWRQRQEAQERQREAGGLK